VLVVSDASAEGGRARLPKAKCIECRVALGSKVDDPQIWVAIRGKRLGPEHPNLARVLENYAVPLRETKRGAAASELEARAQAIRAAHAKHNPPSKA
jgi:hypothetical protein